MKNEMYDVVIIGAGLTGLTLGYLLKSKEQKVLIVEARNRIGGRIHTLKHDHSPPIEMGATWLGQKHISLNQILKLLGIKTFEQIIGDKAIYEAISTSPPYLAQLPPNPEPSLRIVGGTSTLIEKLAEEFNSQQLLLGKKVIQIKEVEDHLSILMEGSQQINTQKVVSTLPPNLLLQTIECHPSLPAQLSQLASQTHTWMGESIKIALTFKKPFWRASHLSGTLFSNVGPISEMYDHSNYEDKLFALKGFLAGSHWNLTKSQRLEIVLNQLSKYYGSEINNYETYEEKIWRKESYTYTHYENDILPHQNNGHPLFRNAYMNGRLWIAGSETAESFPGYMEGAVNSAKFIAAKLRK